MSRNTCQGTRPGTRVKAHVKEHVKEHVREHVKEHVNENVNKHVQEHMSWNTSMNTSRNSFRNMSKNTSTNTSRNTCPGHGSMNGAIRTVEPRVVRLQSQHGLSDSRTMPNNWAYENVRRARRMFNVASLNFQSPPGLIVSLPALQRCFTGRSDGDNWSLTAPWYSQWNSDGC